MYNTPEQVPFAWWVGRSKAGAYAGYIYQADSEKGTMNVITIDAEDLAIEIVTAMNGYGPCLMALESIQVAIEPRRAAGKQLLLSRDLAKMIRVTLTFDRSRRKVARNDRAP